MRMDAKKWIALAVLVAAIFVAYNRNRLYLRDPLGSVTRNGAKEPGAQVFINFSNDVLIENDNQPMYVQLVQHNNHAGSPAKLYCLHWLLCMTDADVATMVQPQAPIAIGDMTGKSVHFVDSDKRETVVALR
jgi:hypothetical protein